MFRNNSYHLNKPRFPEVQIRESWVSWGGKYCFSTPERKEAVYSKLAMRNAFCLLSLTLDNFSYLSFRSFSRDCTGWVLPRADDSGPPTIFWMRHITLSHTPSPSCRLHTFSSGPRLPWLIAPGLSCSQSSRHLPESLRVLYNAERPYLTTSLRRRLRKAMLWVKALGVLHCCRWTAVNNVQGKTKSEKNVQWQNVRSLHKLST